MLLPQRGSKAFTLLELIVVIVILGILALIAIPSFQKVIARSQDSATETTLAALLREAQALAAFENRDVTAADIEAASEDLTIQAADTGVHAASRKIVAWVDGETGAPTLATRTDLLYKVDGSTAGVSLASASGNCVLGQVTSSSSGAQTWVGGAETCTGASAVAGPGSEAPPAAPAAAYQDVVLADSPTAYWRLGEASGTVAADATGNGRAGTYNAGAALGLTGAVAGDTAAKGSGTQSLMNATITQPVNGTLEAWVNVPDGGTKGALVHAGNGEPDAGYGIGIGSGTWDTTGTRLLALYDRVRWIDSGISLSPGWHHVVFTHENGVGTFYLDGAKVATDTGTAPNAPVAGVSVGGYVTTNATYPRTLSAEIDEAAVYSNVLTPERVAAHWNAR